MPNTVNIAGLVSSATAAKGKLESIKNNLDASKIAEMAIEKGKQMTSGPVQQVLNDIDAAKKKYDDLKSNTFGKFNKRSNSEFKETWLSIYLNNTKYQSLQFCLGNSLYLTKVDEQGKFSFKTFDITKAQFELSDQNPIYLPTNQLLQLLSNHITDISLYIIFGLITIAIAIYWFKRRNTKNVLHKEVSHILNNHFFESLTVIEKELIEVLYENHLKGSLISTKLINKIIGVQNKDTMTQNKNRSDYFLKINQKFKFATHKELPLIIKTRDELDKRQFNYGLQETYLSELAILIKK
jgi:thermostable 8-oxoguanine DNA glycosylase